MIHLLLATIIVFFIFNGVMTAKWLGTGQAILRSLGT
jgi:hypothetical protein